jgi:hypothetical protein
LEKDKGAGDAQVASLRHGAREAAKTEKRASNADLIKRAEQVDPYAQTPKL